MATESFDRGDDDDEYKYLVRVRAQVMTRDDSSGGWVPMDGGGMSLVGVRQFGPSPDCAPTMVGGGGEGMNPLQDDRDNPPNRSTDLQYMIHGQRVSDDAVVLNCLLSKDLLYCQPNPTFHHWRVNKGQRFGLTFHRSADAQSFQKCINLAAQRLKEQSNEEEESLTGDDVSLSKSEVASKMSRSETSSLPASRARTPSPLSTHRVNPQRHACTPSPRLSLRILPTSLSTCSSTVSSSNAPTSTSIPSSSYHPFSCPHLDYTKAVKRASGVAAMNTSRTRGAMYETAQVPDYSSALSAQRESMYYSAAAKQTLAKSSGALEPAEASVGSRNSFDRTGNFGGATVVANPSSNVGHSSLPASVHNSVLTMGNAGPATMNQNSTAAAASASAAAAAADSYVHFAQSEELLHAADAAQTLCSKMDVGAAAVSHDYAYPNLPSAESTSREREVNRLRDIDSQSTGRLSNLSQYGIGSSASKYVASSQRYGSGDTLASSRVNNNNRPSHHGGSRSTDRLNTISLQHFDRPSSNDAGVAYAPRDNRSTPTSVKKLEVRVGSRHHSYPQIEQQGVSIKSTNRSIVSFQQSPTTDTGSSRLSTIQLPMSATASASAAGVVHGKRREKKAKTKKSVAAQPAATSRRAQCKDCNEFYDVSRNPRGSCPDAPDQGAACINRVSCMCCVHAALYHCARDEDGQYEPICSCHGGTGGSGRRNCRKWTLLTVLALFVPCLWCFLPMMACHDCCVKRNLSGARHREK